MNLKNTVRLTGQFIVMATLLGFAGVASAGKQGISFYGGLGVGVVAPQDTTLEADAAGSGSVFIAIEEDGWALEYTALATLESGTADDAIDYKASGGYGSLGYRTLESKSGLYFLISAGIATIDIDFSDNTVDHTDGTVVTLGMGMRLQKTERLELALSLYGSNAVDAAVDSDVGNVYMASLRYIWGGTPYDPRF